MKDPGSVIALFLSHPFLPLKEIESDTASSRVHEDSNLRLMLTLSSDKYQRKNSLSRSLSFSFTVNEPLLKIYNTAKSLPSETKLGQGYIFTGVCDSVHRWGGLPQFMLGYHPPPQGDPPARQTPWQGDPLARQTPLAKRPHPLARRPPPPGKETPHAVHAGRYAQQAGGMHPTGMQFLLKINVIRC